MSLSKQHITVADPLKYAICLKTQARSVSKIVFCWVVEWEVKILSFAAFDWSTYN